MYADVLAVIEGLEPVRQLRQSLWTYPAVNAAHILGIGLLLGAILPLDLRLLGAWPGVGRRDLERVLVPVAACGLGLAAASGLLLFSVQARDYGTLALFQAKMVLVVLGTLNALAAVFLRRQGREEPFTDRILAVVSLCCWVAALFAGRFIGFVI